MAALNDAAANQQATKEKQKVNISVPAPIDGIGRALKFARRYAPKEQHNHMDAINELLKEVDKTRDPLTFHSNDDDGDEVQIFIG